MAAMRFDLDGIPLNDEDGRTTAILRFRTVKGLVLALPESAEVTIPWSHLELAEVDLIKGEVHIRFAKDARPRHAWLGASHVLRGTWTDRELLAETKRDKR